MADPLDILTGTIRPRQDDTWSTLAGLAQAVASIPERRARAAAQRAEMEAQQMNAQTRAGELQFRQQALQQQDAAKAKMAQMDQAVNAIVSQAMVEGPDGVKRFDRKRIMEGFARVNAPLEVQAHTLKALDDVEESGSKLEEARRDHAARVLNAVIEAPDTEQAAMMGIATGKANGWLKDGEAEPLMALLASGQDPKPRLRQLRDTLSDKYRAKHEVKDVGPGHQLRDETGALIAENPLQEKPTNPPNVGSFEDYVVAKFGARPTPAQITQARKEYNQSDDRPRVTVPVVIQTAEGPQLLNKGTGTTTPIKTAGGETVQPAPTAEMRNKVEGRKLAAKSINSVEQLSQKIITRVGPGQRAAAIARGAEAVFGSDPDFRTYQDARMALAGNLAVAQQGSRPSDADIKAIWLPLVPDPYRDTSASAKQKWELIRTMSNTPPSQKNPFRD